MAADGPALEPLSGAIVFGYDGSSASERAIRSTAPLLAHKRALVVTVWEPEVGYVVLPPSVAPAPIDIRAPLEVDERLYDAARRTAERGAATARGFGLDAEGLAVADVLTVAFTLVRLARECGARAIVVGTRGHNALRDLLLGSTARDVIRHAPCPVTVVREREDEEEQEEGQGAGAT